MTHENQKRAKSLGHEYWQGEVNNQIKSEMTVAEYSRKHEINANRLYRWRSRIKAKSTSVGKPESKRFVELPLGIPSNDAGESYDIYVGSVMHIRVGQIFNPETLKDLIAMLRDWQ